MLPNFLQKPSGTLAVLVAAVAGPYAAFETDFGTTARRVVSNLVGDSFQDSESPQASNDPSQNQGEIFPQVHQMVPHGVPTSYSALPYPAPQHPASSYPAAQYQGAQYQGVPYPPPIVESNQGMPARVPGGTQELWNYTLGVPTLQNMQGQPQPIGGGEIHDLREVLRFDIYPGWLPQRFSRVTTVLSNVQLDGLRVPLITGTRPTDLAGTLTYYFDGSQALQRINLHGLTGDPSHLANLMVQYYGLRPENSLGGQLFTSRWNNRVSSVLHVAPAPIMYAGADHSKYIVFLELNQHSPSFSLSEEAGALLINSQATQRW